MSSDVTVTWTEPQLPPQQSFSLMVPPCGRREEVQEETPSQICIEHLNWHKVQVQEVQVQEVQVQEVQVQEVQVQLDEDKFKGQSRTC